MQEKLRSGKSAGHTISKDDMVNLNTTIGYFNLLDSVKLILITGLISIIAITVLIIMYFRPAVLTILIPVTVFLTAFYGVLRQRHFCLWPIIGISLFHLFLTLYFDLFFIYFFLFKPNYIIMILNWIFDTLHTNVTVLYYVQCTVIIISTTAFGLFNLWQLYILINLKRFLKHQRSNDRSSQIISIVIGQDENISKY